MVWFRSVLWYIYPPVDFKNRSTESLYPGGWVSVDSILVSCNLAKHHSPQGICEHFKCFKNVATSIHVISSIHLIIFQNNVILVMHHMAGIRKVAFLTAPKKVIQHCYPIYHSSVSSLNSQLKSLHAESNSYIITLSILIFSPLPQRRAPSVLNMLIPPPVCQRSPATAQESILRLGNVPVLSEPEQNAIEQFYILHYCIHYVTLRTMSPEYVGKCCNPYIYNSVNHL